MRRSHRKSRFGCPECKQRRVKCDERRPCCTNCASNGRQCSYLTLLASLPRQSRPRALEPAVPDPGPPPSSAHQTHADITSPASTCLATNAGGQDTWPSGPAFFPSPVRSDLLTDFASETTAVAAYTTVATAPPFPSSLSPSRNRGDAYHFHHFELFHYFKEELMNVLSKGHPIVDKISDLTIQQAFSAPFLLDEILALSAAHKSTTMTGSLRDEYRQEASALQGRAVSGFKKAQAEPVGPSYLVVFLFYNFLGQQTLVDALTTQGELSAALDRFTQFLRVHEDIRAVLQPSIQIILAHIFSHLDVETELIADLIGDSLPGDELTSVLKLLGDSSLEEEERQTYIGVLTTMQEMLDRQRGNRFFENRWVQLTRSVHEWPVSVSSDFARLLEQRRPEALVVLAHYAAFLHHARAYWSVAGAGAFLIRNITNHLGAFWAEWLEWPNKMLSAPNIIDTLPAGATEA